MTLQEFTRLCLMTFVMAGLGLAVFGIAFSIMMKLTPFSIRKEIEEDQNIALAIVMAAVILGIALILKGAISG